MQRHLITIGIILLVVGVAWPFLSKLPIGKLPGDIYISKPNFKIFVPITTMFLASLIASLIMWLMRK